MKFCCLFLALELWHSNTHLPPRPPWSQSHPALPSLSRAEDPAPSCLSWLRTHHFPLSHHAAPCASQPAHLLVAVTPLCPPATSSSSSCCSCFWTCFLALFSFPSLPVHLVLVPPSCWCSPPCHPCSSIPAEIQELKIKHARRRGPVRTYIYCYKMFCMAVTSRFSQTVCARRVFPHPSCQ